MSLQMEKLEHNMAKITIEVPVEEMAKAVNAAYLKNKNQISIPGFRKGKVPLAMVEKMYGKGVFLEDAANAVIPGAYDKAVKECEEEIVSTPTIDVVQLEPDKAFIFTAEVALKPAVELGKYKGVKIDKIETEVTEEEVNEAIDRERKNNAREITVEDRPIQDGDKAVIDFEGFVDGVAFEGGKGTNYDLVIGSHSFIDNFEEQLIGKNIGDEVEVNVTFPESYQAEELAGKPAVFKVKVNGIKVDELPELDDEFASEVSEFETVAEYKDSVKKSLAETKEKNAKDAKEKAAIDAVIADAKMDIPEAMVSTTQRQMMDEFAQRVSSQGLSFEQYLQFTGMTEEQMLEQIKPQAELRIKSRLVLEAVVAAEKIEATEEDFEQEIAKMAEMYQMEADKAKELVGEAGKAEIMKDLAVTKAAEFVRDNAKESKSK
ncbi:trigger factor [Kineothrix sp. MSJ-39]|uniref:trigger factor n=1 Tax=Kineothrix sp. MSJ-39 TaxID=2841533 RepID=UPI001C10BCAD|nr:trigger factor [Kineothrix sp. MSJ-39]MBU5429919.1 trigger factor [Kineothrix sp. MSJ-39]